MDKKFKIFVIVAIVVLTLITVAGGVTVFVMMNSTKSESNKEKVKKESLEIVYLNESINSNLKMDKDNIPHIVRIAVGFEINSKDKTYKAFSADFANKQIVIRDRIISLLRNQTYSEINKEKLSEMIKEEINHLLDTEIIQAVYFSDFFVQ